MRDKLKNAMAEYGGIALTVYLVIFAVVFIGAGAALKLGFEFESVEGDLGTIAAAWLLTKITQPVRIGATLVLTPLVATVLGRKKKEEAPAEPEQAAQD